MNKNSKKNIKFFLLKRVKFLKIVSDIIIGGGQRAHHLGFSIAELQYGVCFLGQILYLDGLGEIEIF